MGELAKSIIQRVKTAKLCSRRGGSGPIQDCCRVTHFRYSKDHQWRIRLRLDTAVCVVNVDIGVAELARGPCEPARQTFPSDPGRLSMRMVNSLTMGMLETSYIPIQIEWSKIPGG